MTLMEFLKHLFLLVGKENISSEGLRHEQFFTKSAASFSQHFVGCAWDNSAECEDKVMDHLLVEVVSSNCI